MLRRFLAARHVGKVVGKMRAAEYPARGRFQYPLLALEHRHVVGLASWLENARDHAEEKHPSNFSAVLRVLRSKIFWKECRQSRRPIPPQSLEVVADGMKFALSRAHVDRLVRRILADVAESVELQPFLEFTHV